MNLADIFWAGTGFKVRNVAMTRGPINELREEKRA